MLCLHQLQQVLQWDVRWQSSTIRTQSSSFISCHHELVHIAVAVAEPVNLETEAQQACTTASHLCNCHSRGPHHSCTQSDKIVLRCFPTPALWHSSVICKKPANQSNNLRQAVFCTQSSTHSVQDAAFNCICICEIVEDAAETPMKTRKPTSLGLLL